MPKTEAQKRATQKYEKKAYDKILVVFKKGEKERIRAAAQKEQKSVNAYIVSAVMKEISETNI